MQVGHRWKNKERDGRNSQGVLVRGGARGEEEILAFVGETAAHFSSSNCPHCPWLTPTSGVDLCRAHHT